MLTAAPSGFSTDSRHKSPFSSGAPPETAKTTAPYGFTI
jgi:hypothetical protein